MEEQQEEKKTQRLEEEEEDPHPEKEKGEEAMTREISQAVIVKSMMRTEEGGGRGPEERVGEEGLSVVAGTGGAGTDGELSDLRKETERVMERGLVSQAPVPMLEMTRWTR